MRLRPRPACAGRVAGFSGAGLSWVSLPCVFAGGINFAFRDHTWPTIERLAYEATMPGPAEEFCWRDLPFMRLGRAYANASGAAEFALAAIPSTLMFSLEHAVSMGHGSAHSAWLPFFYAAVCGAALALIRLRTESLAACILAHNMANFCGDRADGLP